MQNFANIQTSGDAKGGAIFNQGQMGTTGVNSDIGGFTYIPTIQSKDFWGPIKTLERQLIFSEDQIRNYVIGKRYFDADNITLVRTIGGSAASISLTAPGRTIICPDTIFFAKTTPFLSTISARVIVQSVPNFALPDLSVPIHP